MSGRVPVVEAERARSVFAHDTLVVPPGQAGAGRYLHGHVTCTHYCPFFADGVRSHFASETTYQPPPVGGPQVTDSEQLDNGDPNWSDAYITEHGDEVGDPSHWSLGGGGTTADLSYQPDASDQYVGSAALDQPYALAAFCQAAEGIEGGFQDRFEDGPAQARIFLEAAPGHDEVVRPYPWAQGYDHTYELARLHYRFRCNADPQGVVAYDVVFTPEDGSAPVHEVRRVPTGGATRVTDADDKPFVLDPVHPTSAAVRDASQPNGKKNGTYQVVPIQLQPDDWKDADGGGTEGQAGTNAVSAPNEANITYLGQSGTKGAMVGSVLDNTTKHFVSPKKAGDYVYFRAQLPMDDKGFEAEFEWEQAPAGQPQYVISGQKIGVPRDQTGHYTISYYSKQRADDTGTTLVGPYLMDSINVWIVWGSVTAKEQRDISGLTDYLATKTVCETVWNYQASIQPAAMFDITADVPDLLGAPDTTTPHEDEYHANDNKMLGKALHKWNLTRQWRGQYISPTLDGTGLGIKPGTRLFAALPCANWTNVPTSLSMGDDGYPKDELEGNDDGRNQSYPYSSDTKAMMLDSDPPGGPIFASGGKSPPTSNDYVMWHDQWQEFVRVDIKGVWYRVSDLFQDASPCQTRFHRSFRKAAESAVGEDLNANGNQTDVLWIDSQKFDGTTKTLSDATNQDYLAQ